MGYDVKRSAAFLAEIAKYESDIKRHKMAAAAMSPSGYNIATAYNYRGAGQSSKYSIHAEEALYWKLLDRLAMTYDRWGRPDIIVVRAMRSRPYGMAKPCGKCEWLLSMLNPRKVYYTTNSGLEVLRWT